MLSSFWTTINSRLDWNDQIRRTSCELVALDDRFRVNLYTTLLISWLTFKGANTFSVLLTNIRRDEGLSVSVLRYFVTVMLWTALHMGVLLTCAIAWERGGFAAILWMPEGV
jgi:hypothetical protein